MKKELPLFTVSQFAKLYDINKRTLHFYDQEGIFSPQLRKENGYRYYSYAQCMTFEYIRMLKELHLSIQEIKDYLHTPSKEAFLQIADTKLDELDLEIARLQQTKQSLLEKKRQLEFCSTLQDQEIRIEAFAKTPLLLIPATFGDDDILNMFAYLKKAADYGDYRSGSGSLLSLEKIKKGNFDAYDGLFVPLQRDADSKTLRPAGRYLCGYSIGSWEKLPQLYEKMLTYAKEHQLSLVGPAYEMGLNEFAISSMEEYILQAAIRIEE